jgi:hypothetical protein
MGTFYIGHPPGQYDGCPAESVRSCAQNPALHGGWPIKAKEYSPDASLNARDFCSMVLQSSGPVILIESVKQGTIEEVRVRVGARVPVLVERIDNVTDLRATLVRAQALFQSGEPLVGLDVIVGLLMIRKLDQEHMWTGNAKGYMWVSDIPKGRGLDLKYAPRVAHVLNILFQHDLIVCKISNGKKKYALNPNRREEIYEILRCRKLPPEVNRLLLRHPTTETVRVLDLLCDYDAPPERI